MMSLTTKPGSKVIFNGVGIHGEVLEIGKTYVVKSLDSWLNRVCVDGYQTSFPISVFENSDERPGDCIQTYTGKAFWPLDPREDEICIEDIAHSLSLQCRYAGHCNYHYSVAQHSVLVSRALPEKYKLWGLLHDASEAYIIDVPRPIKRFLTNYVEIESNIMSVIAGKFGLSAKMPAEVKRVDSAILHDEMLQIMKKPQGDLKLPEPPLGITIHQWIPSYAEEVFLETFNDLVYKTKD
jgi:uncharacterized protein